MNLLKLIKEEQAKINPIKLSDDQIIQYITDYLYDIFGNSFNINDYKQTDNIKEKYIKILGNNNPFKNSEYITLKLTFKIISKQNGFNVNNIEIDYSDEPGLYKDISKGSGYNVEQIKSFDSNFYRKLNKEIIQMFRFK
jgi:hypothetical protein